MSITIQFLYFTGPDSRFFVFRLLGSAFVEAGETYIFKYHENKDKKAVNASVLILQILFLQRNGMSQTRTQN
jgi:hypothetical protein